MINAIGNFFRFIGDLIGLDGQLGIQGDYGNSRSEPFARDEIERGPRPARAPDATAARRTSPQPPAPETSRTRGSDNVLSRL
ncbi:MAG: hypothetical protein AAFQ82_20765, partial [Myxococcota bacterium]